jgi:hypothetical protein
MLERRAKKLGGFSAGVFAASDESESDSSELK